MEQTTNPNPVRSPHDIVTLCNIDVEDFTFEYDSSHGNYPYVIKAGAVARFPRFLADHALGHLIDKILNREGVKTNNEAARADLRDRIFVGEEVFQHGPLETEADRLKKEVDALNRPSDLDRVLSRAKTTSGAEPLPVVEDKFVEASTEPATEVKEIPTRKELLGYAVKAGLVLDEPDKDGKTLRQVFERMKVEDLIKELNYPME